jgi:uncharacterized protein
MTRLELLRSKREEILSLVSRHGVGNVRVFGSVARGEERPDSDVDLLVDIEPERSLFDLVGAYQDLEDRLHFHVDMVTERGLKERVRERVLREAVAL